MANENPVFLLILLFLPLDARAEYEKFVLKFPWQIQAQYIGFLVAKNKGFYKDEGLELEIVPGTSTREGPFD